MSERIKESLPLGVVVERRSVENRWIGERWLPVAVIPGAPALDPQGPWTVIERGEGWERYHAGTLTLDLFRKETDGYKLNLSQQPPRLFVVLRDGSEAGARHAVVPIFVTVCPHEAQDFLDSGEDIVEPVAMPAPLIALVQKFVDEHHVDQPFYKRQRRPHAPREQNRARGPAPLGRDDPRRRS